MVQNIMCINVTIFQTIIMLLQTHQNISNCISNFKITISFELKLEYNLKQEYTLHNMTVQSYANVIKYSPVFA